MKQICKVRQQLYFCILIIIGMFMLSFAAVPLYNLFCKVTGTGGTVQIAIIDKASYIGKRQLTIYFDANIEKTLPWIFRPEQRKIVTKTGENNLIFYYSENLTDEALKGMAIYNVTPNKAGKYFNKIHCFCFDEQILKPKEKMMMPVSFFIDPELEKDPNLKDVTSITLSYSFFKL